MSEVEARIAALGFELPEPPEPLGEYVPAVKSGSLVFTCGSLPMAASGLIATGKLGADAEGGHVDLATGQRCAAQCAINALAAVKGLVGDLDRVRQVVKVVGYVASEPDFVLQPAVVNGASSVLGRVFGDMGRHARSAVGVAALPLDAPVELELIVEVTA